MKNRASKQHFSNIKGSINYQYEENKRGTILWNIYLEINNIYLLNYNQYKYYYKLLRLFLWILKI
ncbi:hypothetical protein PFAG_01790 [Plasmodium falciparum Santa Lucia]|uniref:Uncharacterized protein n=4 Tax=Plasmodium falciparum TaxID=5833 RepID=W4J571_PLAFP|nr:hypothetical protein PFTANZ_01921 [Plasmodium falciparum Tanzania (2000708)]ETW43697.1 hypothetical protein PFNF135_01957 [Plasmodium falciparum NF135/5.C10]ETW57184.1 hypothetical protein PFUGPA_00959 [Plasmodium falciparum Palo Alto/Uganda]EUT88332.1 hypothetical protein PFAG_01790 [Plasmodium falciparum Santa Lucia]